MIFRRSSKHLSGLYWTLRTLSHAASTPDFRHDLTTAGSFQLVPSTDHKAYQPTSSVVGIRLIVCIALIHCVRKKYGVQWVTFLGQGKTTRSNQ